MFSSVRLFGFSLLLVSFAFVEGASAGALEDARVSYTNKDYLTALNLWRPLAEQGNAEAQRGLGILYASGRGVTKDERQATELFRKAATGGDAEAEYRLGLRLVMGTGIVARDTAGGLNWLVKSGEQGRPNSFTRIGNIYRLGNYGLSKDLPQAVSWFRRAADLGDPEGKAWLGWAYHYGMGISKDTNGAVSWLMKAGGHGYTPAQMELGEIYERGDGVAIDKPKALCWYRKVKSDIPAFQATASAAIARLELETGGPSELHCD